MNSPHCPIRPIRVCRAGLLAGLCAALFLGSGIALAQSGSESTREARNAELPGTTHADALSVWGDRLRGAVQGRLAPIYESFTNLLRPAAARLSWGGTVHFEGVVSSMESGRQEFSRAFAAGESQDAGVEQDSFSAFLLNPRRFRVPWLVAPGNLFHAMPVMPVAMIGSVHIDFVAGTLGVKSGTSAAMVQCTVRF